MSERIREHQNYSDYQSCSIDVINERVTQLSALLSTLVGEGFSSFKTYNHDIQRNVLWACSALIDDVQWHLKHPDEHLGKRNIKGESPSL